MDSKSLYDNHSKQIMIIMIVTVLQISYHVWKATIRTFLSKFEYLL